MVFVKKSYEEIRDNILAQITKGIVNEEHVYEPSRTRYELANTPVKRIVKVEGVVDGAGHIFNQGADYRLTEDMIEWMTGGDKPDERTAFYVNYVFGASSSLSDINPGSVVRTIVEAVSREVEFLYEQLNQVYLAGFIETAMGSALDLVVFILGVERKPAEHATGKVTFGRSTDPAEVQVNREAHRYDGKTIYEMTSLPVKSIAKVESISEGEPYTFEEAVDYASRDTGIEWLPEGKKPDSNSMFYVDYVAYEQIRIPAETRVSTYSRRPEEVKDYVTTEERILEKTDKGVWEADVPVMAAVAGRPGNVYAGAVNVMPQPPMGVEYVINREDILNGTDEEPDEDLRERAKRALEVAGKATLVSLEAGVRGVEGVDSLLVEDMPDGVSGVVKIIVDGGDTEEIMKVINDVRAAGIRVEFLRPRPVHIDVNLTVAIRKAAKPSKVQKDAEAEVRTYLSSLDIGEDVIYSRIIGAAVGVEAVHDVTEMTVTAHRKDGEEAIKSIEEKVEITSEERAIARAVNVLIKTSEEKRPE
jgi:uncharacterized phage protein gp47/JayE